MPLTLAEERVFTAYHEAAHLAAALAFRVMACGATIRPAAERQGLVITVDRRSNSPSAGIEGWLAGLDRLGTHARAVELMAGLAAEEKAGHPRHISSHGRIGQMPTTFWSRVSATMMSRSGNWIVRCPMRGK